MAEQSSVQKIRVKMRTWTAIELRGLPRGGELAVKAAVSGRIRILLLGQEDYDAFPENADALHDATTQSGLMFAQALPRTGDYFLVLDAREEPEARLVEVLVTARAGR